MRKNLRFLSILLSLFILTGCATKNEVIDTPIETSSTFIEETSSSSSEEILEDEIDTSWIYESPNDDKSSSIEEEISTSIQDEVSSSEEIIPIEEVSETKVEEVSQNEAASSISNNTPSFEIPRYEDYNKPFVYINGNVPFFTNEELTTTPFEYYSNLDGLGRCGVAYANICKEIMPTEERDEIGMVKPSGWNQNKYDFVDGKYLYNRCHLIGYQLAGENANEKNLITGTRYLNIEGMLPFENLVDDYVERTNHHVLYRVTPIFEGNNLLCNGVLMEGKSAEDSEICFCVFAFNSQPNVEINYLDGSNKLKENVTTTNNASESNELNNQTSEVKLYILNTNSKKIHLPTCNKLPTSNKEEVYAIKEELINNGYSPCKLCNP